ncbi:unnamed protein product [Alopecurus aequalis]
MLVLLILLCPLAAIYVFGLLISTGISLWRLQHDYGRNSTEEPNLKPALDTLYCLALLQGVLFCYSSLLNLTKKRLAKEVTAKCDDEDDFQIVSNYLSKTMFGCEKDPSSARGRNLITYGVDLVGSKSPDDCLSGVQMLYTAIRIGERGLKDARRADGLGKKEARARFKGKTKEVGTQWEEIIGQHMLMKHLIVYAAPSSPVLQKLLEMLDPRAAYDREMRNQAARIVAHLALDIHLEIHYISTLIGMNFEEYRLIEPYNRDRLLHKYDQNWDRQASFLRLPSPGPDNQLREVYKKLVLRGSCILQKLATHEDNCRIMSQTQGLIPRIMAPLTSDIIHQFNDGAWSISVVQGSLKAMCLLVASPGETGAKLRREISSNKEAIGTMESFLNCTDSCCAKLQKRAMDILKQIHMDSLKNRAAFIKMLVDIFLAGDSKDRSIRKLAGEALVKLSIQGGSNTSIILQANGDVLGSLTKILLLDDAENKTCRLRAAEILEQICVHHTQDDECLSKLKQAMIDTMPKVLAQILSCGRTKDETYPITEEDQVEVIEKEVDIENQSDENGRDKTSSSTRPQNKEDYEDEVQVEVSEDESEDEDFHAPLLSLCVTICNTLISADQDLAWQFGAISLPRKLKDMVAENSVPAVHGLRLMKLTCKMVISMTKHRGSCYLKEELESLTVALSSAAESMSLLDMSMVFASEDDGSATTMKPVRSLGSLVKEAKENVAAYFKP